MIPEPLIPGLQGLSSQGANGAVCVYSASDEHGHRVRVFVTEDEEARHRLRTWAGIEPRSRWVDTPRGGALICRWEQLEPSRRRPHAFDRNPKAALEACLGCLDELARFHELGMSHGGVRSDALHMFHERFVLNPPAERDRPGGRERDLANAKRLLTSLLSPPSSETLNLASEDAKFLACALDILRSEHTTVAELRDELRDLFGQEGECPTIVGGQPSFALTQLNIPQNIDGYEVRGLIGKGGMGYVFEAYDPQLDRELAIKTVRLELLGEAGKERFIREARACSKITHPNVVTVYAAGEFQGDPYMAMELIRGRSMATLLDEDPPTWDTVVRWAIDLLDALERCHSIGIVHRDLKPENIMFTRRGIPKLMDFGLAHIESSAHLTATGTVVGTAHYMSPEQVLAKPVDARSDVFSMGVLLYRAISGSLPFQGRQQMSVMYAIANQEAPTLDTANLGVPAHLQRILARAMAKDPEERYASAGPFRDALRTLVDTKTAPDYQAPFRRWPWVAALAGLAAVVALALILRPGPHYDRALAEQHNELADALVARGDLGGARQEYRQALVADPRYATAWNNLAVLALREGSIDLADSLLRRALQAEPTYPMALFHRGWIAEIRGERQMARRFYESAVAADSELVTAYNSLANLVLDEREYDEARRILDRAFSLPHLEEAELPYLWRSSGRIRAARGNLAGAVDDWQRALKGLPNDPELHESLARAFDRLGDSNAARTHWQRLLEVGNVDQRRAAAKALTVD